MREQSGNFTLPGEWSPFTAGSMCISVTLVYCGLMDQAGSLHEGYLRGQLLCIIMYGSTSALRKGDLLRGGR